MIFDTHYPRLFGIDPTHRLVLDSEKHVSRAGTDRETRWFVEHDGQARIVARYRTWLSRALVAPWREQLGWERYTPDGTLQVREVRHSKGQRVASDPGPWLN